MEQSQIPRRHIRSSTTVQVARCQQKAPTRQWHYPTSQKAPGGPHTRTCDNSFKRSLPPTDYAAVVWHRPKDDGSPTRSTQMRKLTPIQRLAIKDVLECYRTTPTAATEVETATDQTPNQGPSCSHTDAICAEIRYVARKDQ